MGFKQFITEASAFEIWEKYYLPRILQAFKSSGIHEYEIMDDDRVQNYMDNILSAILRTDPTYTSGVSESGSSAPGKFFRVMCEWFLKYAGTEGFEKAMALYPNTGLSNLLYQYDTYNKWLPAQYRSVTAFKTFGSFFAWATSDMEPIIRKAKEAKAYKEANVLIDDSTHLVLIPRTHFASRYFGTEFAKDTAVTDAGWCTTWPDPNYFNQYTAAGIIIMIMDRKARHHSSQLFILINPELKREGHIDHFYMDWSNEVTDPGDMPMDVYKLLSEKYTDKFDECSTKIDNDWNNKSRDNDDDNNEEDPNYFRLEVEYDWDSNQNSYFKVPSTAFGTLVAQVVEYFSDGNLIDSETLHSNLGVSLALLGPSDMPDDVYKFPDINFNQYGLAINFDEDLETWVRSVHHDWNNHDQYNGDDAKDKIIEILAELLLRYAGGRHLYPSARERWAPVRISYLMVAKDSSYPDEDNYVGRLMSELSDSYFPGLFVDSPSEVGDFYIGDKTSKVRVYYDDDMGTLEDALADSNFKRMVDRHYYEHEARKAGQKEFKFSEMTPPSESPQGIVKPIVMVEPAIPGQKRKKNRVLKVD